MSSPRGALTALAAVAIAVLGGVASAGADCVPDLVSVTLRSGQSRTILSNSGGQGSIVDVSPDRTRVLIDQGLRLVTATTSGRVIAQLADRLGTIGTARWSPDGKLVAFAVHAMRAACGSSAQLWVVQASGVGPKKLSDCADYPAWAPDSKQVVFVGVKETGGATLSVIGIDGSDRRDLAVLSSASAPLIAWAPKGNRIAFTAQGSIVVVNADGTGAHTIAHAGSPAWRSDGRRLAVVRGRALQLVRADGSKPQVVDRGAISVPTWSSDGRLAYVKAAAGRKDIVVESPGAMPRRLARVTGGALVFGLYWSPGNARILYLRCRT